MVFHFEERNGRFRHSDRVDGVEPFIRERAGAICNRKEHIACLCEVRPWIKGFSYTALRHCKPYTTVGPNCRSHTGFGARPPNLVAFPASLFPLSSSWLRNAECVAEIREESTCKWNSEMEVVGVGSFPSVFKEGCPRHQTVRRRGRGG
jgi:hypothetical protein